ncbi:2-hydroxyacyl-CoA dehydratase [Ruminococcus sp.]|uniref:2-hydroxyacyl-CoA dehydratase n=1 Tax=Ruminococcus sp. TaxID=41978 RepID=UPI0025D32150|nr:2-hydroxyacyl-CoA dehydratase [Ruminococcus sp.]MCI6616931.1 2-hydroxyacyl-CoA dehydratase [Ruminococcus sp.]
MAELKYDKKTGRVLFTKQMKKEYTILLPNMAPIHFNILQNVFTHYGYKSELLNTTGPEIAQTGLKYVHNDTCYPALLVIGQFIHALQSGKYDVHKTALMITQTGGGCRASNYIFLLRKALKKAGFEFVPVISLSFGMEHNSGFSLSIPLIRRFVGGLVYGDQLMLLSNQTKPYEVNKGESMALVEDWSAKISKMLIDGRGYTLEELDENLQKITKSFSKIELNKVPKVKVGIVGEIYVKYSKMANNGLEDFLAEQDCEVCVPGLMGFAAFKVDNRIEDIKMFGGNSIKLKVCQMLLNYVKKVERLMIETAKKYGFEPPHEYAHTKELVKGVIGYGSKMGEGWLLTAEMLELAETGYENIVCTQPFGCLPNHINGKGAIRKIKEIKPNANIVTIDYDPGAPKVNQENRIKLMLAVGKEQLEQRIKNGEVNTEN